MKNGDKDARIRRAHARLENALDDMSKRADNKAILTFLLTKNPFSTLGRLPLRNSFIWSYRCCWFSCFPSAVNDSAE
jgi:hypothetical protein